ncbi:uncharacterized protein LOC123527372 [Mercenaria mercenaria]|uniref:uncharacterized protein LOC123527372 n=1 Tax=Mercenaria mercenaria TaxID=6596 RepID=UPI00234EBA48|nr:uncharacterized protein LOC123527372 [Mercenaria mercenaria]
MNSLLYEPREGVEFSKRSEVPLLKVRYSVFQTALFCMIADWLKGKVGIGAPTEETVRGDVSEVNSAVNGDIQDKILDEESKCVYDEMVKIKVPGHLKVATSHRRWLRLTYELLLKIGVRFSDKMSDLVRRHDLSKYTHREVLGYAVMFGDGSIDWRQLEIEAEKIEWDNTLHNHYAGNPHHPEYFYPLLEDGKRDKSVPMLKLDPENGKDFVDESIIDMLAARGERVLAKDPEFNVKKWLDIEERYLFRYANEDKMYVKECLKKYEEMAEEFFSAEENVKRFDGYFDSRHVVFKPY